MVITLKAKKPSGKAWSFYYDCLVELGKPDCTPKFTDIKIK